jgi:hypothetical protein
VLVTSGCGEQAPPTIPSIIINNTATNNGGGSGTGSTVPTSCDPVIRVDIKAPVTLAAGTDGDLDATPKSATGPRPDSCNLASGIAWAATPAGVCTLTGPTTSFTPNIHGDSKGTCTVTAVVAGVGGIAVIQVQ